MLPRRRRFSAAELLMRAATPAQRFAAPALRFAPLPAFSPADAG